MVSDKTVEFVRTALQSPAEAIPTRKSAHLVDSKNTKSLGEVVNGGPLPPPPIHKPYSSFAPGTRLLSREPSPCPQAPPTAPPLQQSEQPVYSIIDMAVVVNDIVSEVVISDLKDLAQQSIQEVCFIAAVSLHQKWLFLSRV